MTLKIELEIHELPEAVAVLNHSLNAYARGPAPAPKWLVPLIIVLEHRIASGKPLEEPVRISTL